MSEHDAESGNKWDAAVQAMLSVKDDLEPLPLFNDSGRQVGIGIGLTWWNDREGLRCHCVDESRPCYGDEDNVYLGDDDDDRLLSHCPEDFQRSSARDDE